MKATGESEAPQQVLQSSWRKRAREWLGKSREQAWRPKKRQRVKSFQTIRALDHAMQVALGSDGLLTYEAATPPLPALQRPFHTIVGDSGPENFCSIQFLTRSLGLNLDFFPDPSHAVHRDFMAGLKSAQLWPHTLMCMMAFNARHGPWASDARLWQVHDAMTEYFELEGHSSCPLFKAYMPGFIKDRRCGSLVDEHTAEEIWQDMACLRIWEKKGSSVNLNRFLGFMRESRSEDKRWWSRAHAQTYTCIALDMMSGQRFQELLEATPKLRELRSAEEKRSMKEESAEEANLRRSCQNLMVASTLVYSDAEVHQRQRLILTVGLPWELWHGEQNKLLRNSQASEKWLLSQILGAFDKCAQETFATLSSPEGLQDCLFELCESGEPDNAEFQALVDNEVVGTMAAFAMGLNSARYRRHMFMLRGWPSLSVMFLDPDLSSTYIELLRKDYEGFVEVSALRSPGARRVVARSSFGFGVVMQLVDALRESQWQMNDGIAAFLRRFHKRALATQAAEDGFRALRQCEKAYPTKKPPPMTMFASLVNERVLGQRHHYDEVTAAVGFAKRNSSLPKTAFHAPRSGPRDKKFGSVVGYTSGTKWHSTSPQYHAQMYLDLVAVAELRAGGQLDRLGSFGATILLSSGNLLVRRAGAADDEDWLFVLGRLPDTACMAWPAKRTQLNGTNEVLFEPRLDGSLRFIVMCDLDDWLCYEYEWVSPLWQWLHILACRSSPGSWHVVRAKAKTVKLFSTTAEPLPLLEVAAWGAFWSMERTALLSLAKAANLGDRVASDMPLFQMIQSLGGAVLDLSESDLLDVCAGRLAHMSVGAESFYTDLLNMEEASGMLDPDDAADIRKLQKGHKDRLAMKADFKEHFFKECQRVRPPRPPAAGAQGSGSRQRGRRRQGAGRGAARPPRSRLQWLADRLPSHSEAKAMCPEGGFIWRSLSSGGWQSHYKPFPRMSASWTKWGEREALARNLRYLWSCHLEQRGLPTSACPIEGLFESGGAEGDAVVVAGVV